MSFRSRWTNRGEDAHVRILESAVYMAWTEGLEKVSFGRLAAAEMISKSGVFEHFRSKLELQEAIVERAADRFEMEVMHPARLVPASVGAFWEIVDRWLAHIGGRTHSPGMLAVVMDGSRGRTREVVARCVESWLNTLEFELSGYQVCRLIRHEEDSTQLTFEIYALLNLAHWHCVLGRNDACERARTSIRSRLEKALTEVGLSQLCAAEAKLEAKRAALASTPGRVEPPEYVKGPPELGWVPGPGLLDPGAKERSKP